MGSRVNVGIVGLGEVAQVVHLPILQALEGRFNITALCDISPSLLEQMGDRYGVAEQGQHLDYRELVSRDDVDAVFVLNSDEYHAEVTIAALQNSKHVLVEKPMCLAPGEAEAIIAARDASGAQVMVGYMRRFAPAFTSAVEEVKRLDKINYVRIRDIIGRNQLIVDQANVVHRPGDIPEEAQRDRAERAGRLVREAIGDVPSVLVSSYRFLCGLNSHDLSAMRELIGFPNRVASAMAWNGGRFLTVVFEYDGFCAVLETGVDEQVRFDAHIEVYGVTRSIRIQYDTPYIRHLPTTMVINETVGDSYRESVTRPTFKDPYTHELEVFHQVVTQGLMPKTSPEDFNEDLRLFRMIVEALKDGMTS
jgi:predicted dehydrogenase